MRSTSVPTSTLKNPAAYVYAKVEVNGVDLSGRAQEVTVGENFDSKIRECDILFNNPNDPAFPDLRPGSGSAYTEHLKPNKTVKIYFTAKTTKGYAGAVWDLIFDGWTGDSVVCERTYEGAPDKVRVHCRDLSKKLSDYFILDERVYPTVARDPADAALVKDGIDPNDPAYSKPVQDVMQEILNDNGFSAIVLNIAQDPAFAVFPYKVNEISVWEALQNAVSPTVGFDLRYKFTGGQYKLTVSDPLVVGGTDTLDRYRATTLNYTDANIRNLIRVYWRSRDPDADKAAGALTPPGAPEGVFYVEVQNAASITEFGKRQMKVVEDETSLIDTKAEATTFANLMLADLKDIAPSDEIISVGALYHIEVYDTLTLSAAQGGTLSVTSTSITVGLGGRAETRIQGVRRSVVRESENHIRREVRARSRSSDISAQTTSRVGIADRTAPEKVKNVAATGGLLKVSFEFDKVKESETGKSLEDLAKYKVYYKIATASGIPTIDPTVSGTYTAAKLIDNEFIELAAAKDEYIAARIVAVDRTGREARPSAQVESKAAFTKIITVIDAGVIPSPTTGSSTVWTAKTITVPTGHVFVACAFLMNKTIPTANKTNPFDIINEWHDYRFARFENIVPTTPQTSYLTAGTYTVDLVVYHYFRIQAIETAGGLKHTIDSSGNLVLAGTVTEAGNPAPLQEDLITHPPVFWTVWDMSV